MIVQKAQIKEKTLRSDYQLTPRPLQEEQDVQNLLSNFGRDQTCLKCGAEIFSWHLSGSDILVVQIPRFTITHTKNDAMVPFPQRIALPQITDEYGLLSVVSHYGSGIGHSYRST